MTPGEIIKVDRIDIAEGDTVELDKVLLIGQDDKVTVGNPIIEGAKVLATAHGEGRDKKVIVFRYKSKVRHRNKTGHRQYFTELSIDKILEPGAAPEEPAKKTTRRRVKKEETESGT